VKRSACVIVVVTVPLPSFIIDRWRSTASSQALTPRSASANRAFTNTDEKPACTPCEARALLAQPKVLPFGRIEVGARAPLRSRLGMRVVRRNEFWHRQPLLLRCTERVAAYCVPYGTVLFACPSSSTVMFPKGRYISWRSLFMSFDVWPYFGRVGSLPVSTHGPGIGTSTWSRRCHSRITTEATMARGALLWLLGVPIPIIILLFLFWH
jgi:hypothetical protein